MELADAPGKLDHRDVIHLSKRGHCLAEPAADLTEDRRRGDRHAPVIVQEREHLPAHLQRRHIAVEINAVQALDVQHRVTIQQFRDRDHMRHEDHPCPAGITLPSLNLPAPVSRQNSQPRRSEAEPRWLLRPEKLGWWSVITVVAGGGWPRPLGLEGIEAIMFRTIGDRPSAWESLLPPEVLRLPEELARVDALLDDPVFFAPFAPYFHPVLGRPSTPAEWYLRLMFLKFRYRLGFETLCAEVADSISWRRFCRIPLDGQVPHPTTLIKLTSRCGSAAGGAAAPGGQRPDQAAGSDQEGRGAGPAAAGRGHAGRGVPAGQLA